MFTQRSTYDELQYVRTFVQGLILFLMENCNTAVMVSNISILYEYFKQLSSSLFFVQLEGNIILMTEKRLKQNSMYIGVNTHTHTHTFLHLLPSEDR